MTYEIKYPQNVRGGAGFFPEEGKVVIEGYGGAEIELTVSGSPNGNGNSSEGITLTSGLLLLVWKRAGSTDHPKSDSALLQDSRYRQIGSPKTGYDTTLEFTIEIVDPSGLGSGPNGKGWYFYPDQAFLKPDFDRGSAQSTGTMQIWVNDGHKDIVGGCKWSRNVGSGIDGFILNIDGGVQPVSENYPRLWPAGSKIRVQINYWIPPA